MEADTPYASEMSLPMEICPCGSGRRLEECCYAKYPSIVCSDRPPDPADFYARWAISRNMLWRFILRQAGRPGTGEAGSIVVLGAGSCRDLPMDFLCETFDDVVLVDKNSEALKHSALFVPAGMEDKIVKVCWDVSGEFGARAGALLAGMKEAGRTAGPTAGPTADTVGAMESFAAALQSSLAPWRTGTLPAELKARLPYSFVLSDLIMTQLSMNLAFELSLALDTPLRELYDRHKDILLQIATAASRNHLRLLNLLAGPSGTIMILNDTFMFGRDFDGSQSLFNQVAAARGKDAADASWISAADLDDWMAGYSLLGSDLGSITGTDRPDEGMALVDKIWWWWPHCMAKSYLVVGYALLPPVGPCEV